MDKHFASELILSVLRQAQDEVEGWASVAALTSHCFAMGPSSPTGRGVFTAPPYGTARLGTPSPSPFGRGIKLSICDVPRLWSHLPHFKACG